MLKKYSEFFKSLFITADTLIIFSCWALAYAARFHFSLIPTLKGVPTLKEHIILAILILPIFVTVFQWFGLYNPMRIAHLKQEFIGVIKASTLSLMVIVVFFYFFAKNYRYSRLTLLYFWVLNIFFISLFRAGIKEALRFLRKRGYNLRHVLIIGAQDLAKKIAVKIQKHPEFGMHIIGFLGRETQEIGKEVTGAPVLGIYRDLQNILAKRPVDRLFFALPPEDEKLIRPLLDCVSNELVNINIALDFDDFFTLRPKAEDLDGLPIITLRDSPLSGWGRLIKRMLDLVISLSLLLIVSPLLFLSAIFIKLGSRGPIFYKQRRVALDGKSFTLYKFRTMRVNAEEHTGPVWARENDTRVTNIGKILRKLSIDEFPQIFNVLKGEMGLVGPRPERPLFVDTFRKHIPQYMLRHKIKSGMTGWAQIHGLRGNTSLERRITYDLYYIRNWSIWLDLKILLLTIPAIFKKDGAY